MRLLPRIAAAIVAGGSLLSLVAAAGVAPPPGKDQARLASKEPLPIALARFEDGEPAFRRLSPAERCADIHARFVARLAYIEIRLSLDGSQQAAWKTFADAAKAAVEPMNALCLAGPPRPDQDDVVAVLRDRERPALAMAGAATAMRQAAEALSPSLRPDRSRLLAELMTPPGPPPLPPGGPHGASAPGAGRGPSPFNRPDAPPFH
ncbi:hypothetical protein [Terrarubrum flagellatum]|uniref:hypothetical protein n=1 Tax=Terrirubrum flagellatum TaxID=2895980 RepID=UPI003144ED1F